MESLEYNVKEGCGTNYLHQEIEVSEVPEVKTFIVSIILTFKE